MNECGRRSPSLPLSPPQVRFIITTRPEPHIKASLEFRFNPFSIEKEDARHVGDLRQLIAHQLRGRVDPPSDLDRAVDVMQEKAEGAFVYIARAFDDLDNQERQMWTVQQLGDMLPKVGTVLPTVTCLTCPRHAPDINAPCCPLTL